MDLGTTSTNPKTSRLAIIGAGGHAKVVADAALACGMEVVGFLSGDGDHEVKILGIPVLGPLSQLAEICAHLKVNQLFVGIGDNAARKRIAYQVAAVGLPFATVVHPSAVISPFANISPGTLIMPGAVVNAGAQIGSHVILNTSCSIDHDCQIGDFAHISPGAHLAGHIRVGEGAHIGIGAAVIQERSIGEWAVVGAQAAVIRDIPPRRVAVGVPARVIRELAR